MNQEGVVGVFMGLESSSNEYIAWLIAPYKPDFGIEIGQLLLIESASDHIVARVMEYVPRGEFTSSVGEKWLNEIASQGAIDEVGRDIKKSKVSYRVRVRVLGSLEAKGEFAPGLRRIPQITSRVRRPDPQELKGIIQKAMKEQENGVCIGTYDLDGAVEIRFDQSELNEKRTFIFARAGYGKSNLMKVLSSEWRSENGGLLVFDPEGEYAVTDRKGRPGVMDRRPAILLTNQNVGLEENVHSRIKLNLSQMSHKMIMPILVNPDKHETVFFAKLMAMQGESWPELVEVVYQEGWGADHNEIRRIVLGQRGARETSPNEVSTAAILNNLVGPIRELHDPNSDLMQIIEKSLRAGHVVIFDTSRVDARTAQLVGSIIIKHVFNVNKDNFVRKGGDKLIKATFVFEEAHTILAGGGPRAPSAFVELAKEGRKYGLGGIFITQQPGSVPSEIISQGDNFFVFHLLSKTDLAALSRANAHYSDDIITQILNEPVRGKSYMWTSHQPFVVPIKVTNFEDPDVTTPHNSVKIQEKSPLLKNVKKEVNKELNDPRHASIYDKFMKIEENNPNIELKKKTVMLFGMLTDDEKKLLDSMGNLQKGFGDDIFAVTFPYYTSLQGKR